MILHFLKAIRFPNLLIIALTQYLLRYAVIGPVIKVNGFDLLISHLDFFLLSLSTVMIAAAGYIINDYFDLKIDKINKPESIVIGKHIKRRVAMGAHIVMNIIGMCLGLYVSYKVGNLTLAFIHGFAILSLWYYSTNFKYELLLGNFVIALMAAMVPLVVGLYEVPLLNKWGVENFQIDKLNFNFNHVAYFTIGLGCFSFLMTMAREITKDCADIYGDQAFGAKTLPIAWGDNTAKAFITLFYLATIAGLFFVQQSFLTDLATLGYFAVISLLLLFTIFKTWKSNDRSDYLFSSKMNKVISLLGILYMAIFPWILVKFVG